MGIRGSLIVAVGVAAIGLVPAGASAAITASGPREGQPLRGYPMEAGSTRLQLFLPSLITATDGPSDERPRLLVATSGQPDASGMLVPDVADARADEFGDDQIANAEIRHPAATLFWQVVHGAERTPIRSFQLLTNPLAAAPVPGAGRLVLKPSGYRGIETGMTLRKARSVSKIKLKRSLPINDMCTQAYNSKRAVNVLLLRGQVARVSFYGRRAGKAIGGARVGDSIDTVIGAFGLTSFTTEPHAYVQGGFYWDLKFGPGIYARKAIRWETDAAGKITAIHGGRPGATALIEGCA